MQNIISKILFFNTCLTTVLSIHKISNLLKLNSRVIIGINNSDNKFHSHAWIEIENALFYDFPEKNYKKIMEF